MVPTAQFGWSKGFTAPVWAAGPIGMGDARPITDAIGGGLLSAGGVIAAIPGGQLPGAIVAGVGALTRLIGGLFAPDLTKIAATHIVDAVAAEVLEPTLHHWQSLSPQEKTPILQAASLELIDAALNKVQQGCSNPALGTAGQHCISERLIKGGTAPWCPTHTGCDWITLFRDPIANDPQVAANVAAAASSAGADSSATGGATPPGQSQSPTGGTAVNGGSKTGLYVGLGLLVIAGFLALGGGD